MIVTEEQVLLAMDHFEKKHIAEFGPLDRINVPKAVATLADLLGAMWYEKEREAMLPDSSKTAALLREALGLPDVTPVEDLPDAAAPTGAAEAPLTPDQVPVDGDMEVAR
jgi:hypothetical protein